MLLCGLTWVAALSAQVEQLATSHDGQVLLFHSRFRLRTEQELGPQSKIYRWQNGVFTRLAAAPEVADNWLVPPNVSDPFLSMDGTIVGWQVDPGCLRCRIAVGPVLSSAVSGVSLPEAFPRGTLRMSANGRYFIADSYPFDDYPFSGVQYVDMATGAITDVPVSVFNRPVVRELANDGTALLLLTKPDDAGQNHAPGTLALWKPGSEPQPLYSDTRVFSPTLSATGGRVAFEAMVEGGPEDNQRNLVVLDTQTGERISVATMPPRDYDALRFSFAQPVWDVNGTKLIYRTFDEQAQPVAISLWETASRTSRVLLTHAEGFASAVLSGDGMVVWAVTNTNRLLRLNLSTGVMDEILPPLGTVTQGADNSSGVPGSALLIRGTGFTKEHVASDGEILLPIVDAVPEGLWMQMPWEYASSPEPRKVFIRPQDHPFEALVNLSVAATIQPRLHAWTDPATGISYAKAVHQDFQSLVTPANPARPGETVHVYLAGLGPLDTPVPTGAPGPSAPLVRPVTPLHCSFGLEDSVPQPLLMPYLGYATGLVGIYQADLTLPENTPQGTPILYCTASDIFGNRFGSTALLSTTSAR